MADATNETDSKNCERVTRTRSHVAPVPQVDRERRRCVVLFELACCEARALALQDLSTRAGDPAGLWSELNRRTVVTLTCHVSAQGSIKTNLVIRLTSNELVHPDRKVESCTTIAGRWTSISVVLQMVRRDEPFAPNPLIPDCHDTDVFYT